MCGRSSRREGCYQVRWRRIYLPLLIDRFCAFFSLAHSTIECCASFDFIVSLFVDNTPLKPQSISWLIADFMSVGGRCFIVFRLFQRCGDVASTVQRRFLSRIQKLELGCLRRSCESWNLSSMFKGKNVHLLLEVELNFSLGTSESEADERYLFLFSAYLYFRSQYKKLEHWSNLMTNSLISVLSLNFHGCLWRNWGHPQPFRLSFLMKNISIW